MGQILKVFLKLLPVAIIAWYLYDTYNQFHLDRAELISFEGQKKQIEAQMNKARAQIKKAREFEKNLESGQARIRQMQESIRAVQRKLPNTISDPQILGRVTEIADGLRVRDIDMRPVTEVKRDFFYSRTYQFKSVGTYLQFIVFFESVGGMERVFNVQDFKLIPMQSVKKGRFKMLKLETTLETFRFGG